MDSLTSRYELLARYSRYLTRFSVIWEPTKKSFSRKIIDFLIETIRWLLKHFYFFLNPLCKPIKEEKADIVVFGTCKVDISRSMDLWKILEDKGYKVQYLLPEDVPLYKTAFKYRIKINKKIPSIIFFHALIAKYIINKYSPRLICLFHQNNVMPSLIRLSASDNIQTVFIPHAVISSHVEYSVLDFDFYLVFGESSVNNLRINPLRVGSSKVVKTGSTFVNFSVNYVPVLSKNDFLFFSAWDIGKTADSTENFLIIMEFAKRYPEYKIYIKLHPLEDGRFVIRHSARLPNVIVLGKSVTLKEAVEKASLVITTISNACIEAALMARPTIVVNIKTPTADSFKSLRETDSYLHIEHFFLPRARNPEELHNRILEMLGNYEHFTAKCKDFAKFHYEHPYDAADYMAIVLESIFKGKEDFPYEEVNEDIRSLSE